MKDINSIRKLNSVKYFAKLFSKDEKYEKYNFKIVYFDKAKAKNIIKDLRLALNNFSNNDLLNYIQLKLSGYIFQIKFIFSLKIARKYKGVEKIKFLTNELDIVDLYKLDNDTLDFIKHINSNGYELSGIKISFKGFEFVRYFKNSNCLYPVFESKTTHTLLITNTASFYFFSNRRIPLTIKWLCKFLSHFTNDNFKELLNLIFDIFYDENYMIKDVKNYILNNKYYLLPIKFNELNKYHNYNEYFTMNYKKTYNINFNKNDINFNYILFNIYKYIDIKDIQKFIIDFKLDFNENKSNYLNTIYYFNKKYEVLYLIIKKIYFKSDGIAFDYLYDYIKLCKNNKSKIKIKYLSNLKKVHDKEVEKMLKNKKRELKLKFIYKNSKFKRLIKNMPDKYTLIKSEYCLWEEGQTQHNCVYTYKDKIINDDCIIYKYLKNNDTHYTIEIGINENKYILKQMKNTYNKEPTVEDYNEVKTDIDNINILVMN